jgi:hypothetical protein
MIKLSQSHYIDSPLKKYRLTKAKPVTTPMDLNVKLNALEASHKPEGEVDLKVTYGYAQLISSLMYLALGTRPDIAFSVNKLSQYTSDLKPMHWTAIKHIFRYLKYTKTYMLTFRGDNKDIQNININIFCDADWANNTSDRKSISGYVLTMAGGAVAWSLKKQSTIALSTAKAEYVSVTHIAKQVLWH